MRGRSLRDADRDQDVHLLPVHPADRVKRPTAAPGPAYGVFCARDERNRFLPKEKTP